MAHVLPVSDDGGSTAEVVRVLGGPAVGDIRSRCLRLADDSNEEVRRPAAGPCQSLRARHAPEHRAETEYAHGSRHPVLGSQDLSVTA